MDDMLSRISEILSNPEAANKLKDIAISMGSGNDKNIENNSLEENSNNESQAAFNDSGFDMTKMTSILSGLGSGNNKNIVLLNAIRPYMRKERSDKIGSAIKAIQVINILSNLK